MPTIRQLAQLAGVSTATVSRALNDQPGVSQAVRQQIIALAEQYHYRPNRLINGLMTGKSQTIGCVVPTVNSMYFSRVLTGILEEAFARSYHVITLQSHHMLLHTKHAIQLLVEQRVEGVLLATGHYAAVPVESLNELWSHDITPVALDYTPTAKPIDGVATDENSLAHLAVDYLMELGHREIAFVGPLDTETHRGRGWAIHDLLRQKGLSREFFVGSYEISPIEGIFEQLFGTPPYPTAIIAFSDVLAMQLIQYASLQGWHIPHDVSVLGYGNMPFSEYALPPITTIDQSPDEIGRQAVALLDESISANQVPGNRQQRLVNIPPRLIKRGSCTFPHPHGK